VADDVFTLADLGELAFQHENDLCLSFWAMAVAKEWIDFPQRASVLEIGCAEADWQTPMLAIRPDLQITGLDWRACRRPGRFVRGNVLNPELFEPASFDCIVAVSSIEHVGLGAYEGDPKNRYGDREAMQNAFAWLKPGGWMYLDVPYRPDGYTVTENYRGYDDQALTQRLVGQFTVSKWAKCVVEHPDGPYMALLLTKS
jgi:SAM-dependent methyltransferase